MFLLLAQEGGAQAQQPQPQAQPPGGGLGGMLVPLVGTLLIFYFLLIRPQKKAEKARRAKLDAIKKGDVVRTRGGIEGVVARVQDDKVILRIDTDGKVQIPFGKAYIEDVLTEEPAEESKTTK